MVEEIIELEDIEQRKEFLGKGTAYTYSSSVVEKKLGRFLQHVDSAACKADEIVAFRGRSVQLP